MATPIGQKIKSAYAFRRNSGPLMNFQPLYKSNIYPKNRPNIWKDFWLNQISVSFLTKSLSDSLSTGGGQFSSTFS